MGNFPKNCLERFGRNFGKNYSHARIVYSRISEVVSRVSEKFRSHFGHVKKYEMISKKLGRKIKRKISVGFDFGDSVSRRNGQFRPLNGPKNSLGGRIDSPRSPRSRRSQPEERS